MKRESGCKIVTVFSLYFIELDARLYALTNIFIQVTDTAQVQ